MYHFLFELVQIHIVSSEVIDQSVFIVVIACTYQVFSVLFIFYLYSSLRDPLMVLQKYGSRTFGLCERSMKNREIENVINRMYSHFGVYYQYCVLNQMVGDAISDIIMEYVVDYDDFIAFNPSDIM
eukprot:296220_1